MASIFLFVTGEERREESFISSNSEQTRTLVTKRQTSPLKSGVSMGALFHFMLGSNFLTVSSRCLHIPTFEHLTSPPPPFTLPVLHSVISPQQEQGQP